MRRVFPRHCALAIAVAALLALPFAVAVVALYPQGWAPLFDLALTEQRVRDVGGEHTPLLGLPGRLGPWGHPAHHPGPLSFYMLAPLYRLLGSSAWALQLSTGVLNVTATVVAVLVAWRRRSVGVLAAVSLSLALLMQGYGPTLLTEPWNPNFPVLWFVTFLVAAFSVICGDLPMLPVLVVTASICAQTHISYVPICGAFSLLAVATASFVAVRAPKRERAQALRYCALSLLVLIALWLPPLVEELANEPGNATRLLQFFTDPEAEAIGPLRALSAVLARLDVWYVVFEQTIEPGGFGDPLPTPEPAPSRGAIMLIAWVSSALGSLPLRNRRLLVLHGLTLFGLVVAVLATSRIIGDVYAHVMLWSWGIGMLVMVACAATVVCFVARAWPPRSRARLAAFGPALMLGAVSLITVRGVWAAASVRPSAFRLSSQLRALADATIEGIDDEAGMATGHAGRYLVSWTDPLYGGTLGVGLANELERAGLDVAYPVGFAAVAGPARVRKPEWATARVHLALGRWIGWSRRVRGAVEVARVDPRSREDLAEARALEAVIIEELEKSGKRDLVKRAKRDLPGAVASLAGVSPVVGITAKHFLDLGQPAAVFIMPPKAEPKKPRKRKKKRKRKRKRRKRKKPATRQTQ